MSTEIFRVLIVLAAFGACAGSAAGQTAPWVTFEDPQSTSICDLINAENAELVLLDETGQLVDVSGRDTTLTETFVDENSDVFVGGENAGFLSFEDDGDGLRSLWWVSLDGNVMSIDVLTGEPAVTDAFASDFVDVPCDACDFWDDQALCESLSPVGPQFNFDPCGVNSGATLGLTGLILWTRRKHRRSDATHALP